MAPFVPPPPKESWSLLLLTMTMGPSVEQLSYNACFANQLEETRTRLFMVVNSGQQIRIEYGVVLVYYCDSHVLALFHQLFHQHFNIRTGAKSSQMAKCREHTLLFFTPLTTIIDHHPSTIAALLKPVVVAVVVR
jgi:hypothetical protein